MLIAVLGAGQLGRMLAQAAAPMGHALRFLAPSVDAPVRDVGELIVAEYTDRAALERLIAGAAAATFEFENVPVEAVEYLAERVRVRPGAGALRVGQDRLLEKQLFERAGLEVHAYAAVESAAEVRRALGKVGLPAVLKSRRGGYDGKGQAIVRRAEDAERAWESVGGRPALLEQLVPFTRELSIVAVRGEDGSFGAYPLIENRHEGGILRESRAPAKGVAGEIEQAADRHVRDLMQALEYVGVMAVEFFEFEGRLLANEMAPRVHNSGHWTIEGARTSQFENHLRALLGLGLGSCEARGESAMVNLIGGLPEVREARGIAGAHVHTYGKGARAGRKVGHITLVDECGAVDEAALGRARAVAAGCEFGPF